MGKYSDRLVLVNGKMYYIQNLGGDGSFWAFLIIIAILFWVYTQVSLAICMPNEEDYKNNAYRERAKEVAVEYMINLERSNWIDQGFINEKGTVRSFNVEEGFWSKNKNVTDVTKYYNDGRYQILVSTKILLTSTSEDKTVTKDMFDLTNKYIVTLKASPKRLWYGLVDLRWMVENVRLADSSKKTIDLQKTISSWKVPPNKILNW